MAANDKLDAEHELWAALETRRENLRAAKLWTGRTEQQHRKLEAAYDDGRLIDTLVEAMERRARSSAHSPVHLSQMAKTIKSATHLGADPDRAEQALDPLLHRASRPRGRRGSDRGRAGLADELSGVASKGRAERNGRSGPPAGRCASMTRAGQSRSQCYWGLGAGPG